MELKADYAKLLVQCGTDEKLKHVNMEHARRLFEEVLELFPAQSDAMYRLGHVYFELRDYRKSVEYFLKALSQPMSDVRKLRSYITLSKAYFWLDEHDQAISNLDKAKALDEDRNFTSELDEAIVLFSDTYPDGRIVKDPSGKKTVLSNEEVDELLDGLIDKEAILDFRDFTPMFTGLNSTVPLERKEARILEFLYDRRNRHVNTEEIMSLWEEGERPALGTIKSYISKIRTKVKASMPTEYQSIIINKHGLGYRWVCPVPLNIFHK